jgi:DNA-directed RNA polymerase subunit E'/Rpb7
MTKIFKKYKITTLINLSIFQISNTTIDDAILERLQLKYENKISKYGYIKENSIEIIKRSAGTAMKEHFNSSFQFKAICYALICNPSIDTILKAEIVSSNNAGFKAEVKEKDTVIIDIIIPRLTAGIKHEYDIEDLETGKSVYIKICRKRYHYNDNKIVVIGVVINNPNDDNDDDPDEFVDTVIPVNDEYIDDVLIVSEDELDDDEEEDDDDDSVIDLVNIKEETDEEPDDPDDFDDKDLDEEVIDDIEDDF